MSTKKSDLRPLLKETPLTYYWLGFLIADGNFQNNLITLHLGIKDLNHMKRFRKFIKYTGKANGACVFASDKAIVPNITKKFGITSHKTINPCMINHIKKDALFLSFVIGFIDGDGAIVKLHKRPDCAIRIKCYKTWLDNLQYISDRICNLCGLEPNKAIINSEGYAQVIFSNHKILKYLKKKVIRLKLPVLQRKWGKIDEKHVNRMERGEYHKKMVFKLLKEGYRKIDIAKKLGLVKSAVTLITQRNSISEVV